MRFVIPDNYELGLLWQKASTHGYAIDKQTSRLVHAWLFFAVSSLIFAGIFAFLLAMSRTPFIQDFLQAKDYLYTALVIHVNLSVVIWFLSFMGVLWILAGSAFLEEKNFNVFLYWIGFSISSTGTVIIIVSGLKGLGKPILANYIPVLTHPIFYTGLIMFASGIFLTILNTFISIIKNTIRLGKSYLFSPFTFAMTLSGLIVIIAISCFSLAYYFLPNTLDINTYFERLFWGGGHILQFSNTFGMICAWLILTQNTIQKSPMPNRPILLFLLISFGFTLPAPFFYLLFDILSRDLQDWFTLLMQFGSGPIAGVFALSILISTNIFKGNKKKSMVQKNLPWRDPGFSALIFSIILFSTGGILAFMIRGIDVKIPSHYHGVIGGVTLSFMGLSYYILPLLNRKIPESKIVKVQPYLYGIGQMLFIVGMFWAGTHGVPRKTYGYSQKLDDFVKLAGMGVMGLGGVIAISGGVVYVFNILIPLLKTRRI
ncbi:MAG: cbb3-type cytochrome c oxidase subunit I [Nitrospinota bacterium]